MSMLAIKLLIGAGILAALSGGAYALRTSIYNEGVRDGLTQARAAIDAAATESARKNATIVRGDQALIIAKTEDKEKIQIIYRTIREQLDAQIIEKTVYRDAVCNVPADGLRLIAQAAAGATVRADPADVARDPAPGTAGPKR